MREPELSGVTIVGAGSFNPAIIHPTWLREKGLIPANLAEDALENHQSQPTISTPQLSTFVADWLAVQVTQEQAVFSTVEEGRQDELRDIARGIFELLPETPVDAIGINSDTHFRLESEQVWHEFGDKFLPKDFWEPLFSEGDWLARPDGQHVGLRSMTIEVTRGDSGPPGFVRTELGPSVRITPNGIYAGINCHYQLSRATDRSTASKAGQALLDQWQPARELQIRLVGQLLEAV